MPNLKINIFSGGNAFSSATAAKLTDEFNFSNNSKATIECIEVFLVSAEDSCNELDRCKRILGCEELAEEFDFFVGPRRSTISPWSSKTEDIFKNVGIVGISRIERFYGFKISNLEPNSNLDLSSVFDRMTQSIYSTTEELAEFFFELDKRGLGEIDIISGGKKALEDANTKYGFAISNDEIDYLLDFYNSINRNPTDAELMMFSQANSEHCRHKIFNTDWQVDGEEKEDSLFQLIKKTSKESPKNIISAYKDNAAIVEGVNTKRLSVNDDQTYELIQEKINSTIKVETHNHPTAISPFPGASTGSGGEIRDEGATGMGAKPKVGLVGFNVSNLRLPDFIRPWENDENKPERIASPLEIMIDAPLGGAAFNNEFGRPSILGYFRSFETSFKDSTAYGYHKPIMLAGGIGEIIDRNNFKKQISEDYLVIVLGGPSMLIGLGGGAASSMSSGQSDEDLDFASVQRDNAEMERRCQEVINTCNNKNPSIIEFIHDVGAGGLSNAIPELAKDSELGVYINLKDIPCADLSMSPMEIWSNESQERYVLSIHSDNEEIFTEICERERCPFAVVGKTTTEKYVKLFDESANNYPVDVPLSMLFGELPLEKKVVQEEKNVFNVEQKIAIDADNDLDISELDPKAKESVKKHIEKSAENVLSHPTVGSKSFLITIGDRSVGGMVARDQFVGKWQVPTSNYAMSLRSFDDVCGEVISIGERPALSIHNAAASMRMAVAEAVTNMMSVPIESISSIRASANWMAACGENIEDLNLRKGVEALSNFCIDLGIAIPVGKDSLSMRTTWEKDQSNFTVKSPMTGIISAMAPVKDVRTSITTEYKNLEDPCLVLVKPNNFFRLNGSIYQDIFETSFTDTPDISSEELLNLFNFIQSGINKKNIHALHDISDGGILTTLSELCFTNKIGCSISLDNNFQVSPEQFLFSEEIGVVIQINESKLKELKQSAHSQNLIFQYLGKIGGSNFDILDKNKDKLFSRDIAELEQAWSQVSYRIKSIRDNKDDAKSEFDLISKTSNTGLFANDSFKQPKKGLKILNLLKNKPKVAILREQGVNGQNEMAAAFIKAGFEAHDIHMQDLLEQKKDLNQFNGLAVCGGFSYGDVLGAGKGWSSTINFSDSIQEQFLKFFEDEQKFTLGVCNGCQMLSSIKEIIPGTDSWPSFQKNHSDQFEARLSQVKILKSKSVLLNNMEDWSLPIIVSHGEGRASFENEDEINKLFDSEKICMTFVDSSGYQTEQYPLNPNKSPSGITGITNDNGNITIMMPHPERVFRSHQFSWKPLSWGEFSPWMQIFINAKKFVS
ncbi:MAG: phosphoribosylformylglycinamidine synthase [Gammaproteobacteria bacterium]|nr:MAG: phosphoribosylformylglycinamidine synthase [Gammaproteobacteria bacterium]